jgi:hypothetical protein
MRVDLTASVGAMAAAQAATDAKQFFAQHERWSGGVSKHVLSAGNQHFLRVAS